MSSMNSLAHLRIPLDDIKLATNDFNNENVIGVGGFGKVYKGELSGSEGWITVAVKRLDQIHGQGQREFLMEITMLSRYQHKNIVTLLGFCDENDEMILVYEHMVNGSLDIHLSRIGLTWSQRLKICCGAARGLSYLHNLDGGLQRVLHRDIKSSNILLDHMGKAKISDFGLAKLGPANQQFTFLVTHAAGTQGYCDPQYLKTGILTKESDVYSFGIVLFEVLCGRLCVENYNDNRRFLTQLVEESYEQNKMDDIIDVNIKAQMDPESLAKFIAIAYKCLKKERDERPTMAQVVKEIKVALDLQEKWIAKVADLQSTLSIFKRKYKLRQIAQLRDKNPDVTLNIDFDCDEELFATAGGTKNSDFGFIKIFNLSKIVNEPLVEHHPVVDIQTSSWLYGLSWNKNIKNHIACCDNEGAVTIWDVNNKLSVMEYKEHEGRVSSVDFSCTEPSLLVSGGTEDSKVGADYGCHYYDLRSTSHPLNIFTRVIKNVSNVRFLSDDELVFVSVDNTLRLWDIKQNLIVGTYKGHTNEKYITGLSINSDFMACGSERNEVFIYHKAFSKPLTCHALGSPFCNDKHGNATPNTIPGVCWKSDGSTVVACNDNGVIQVLAFEA